MARVVLKLSPGGGIGVGAKTAYGKRPPATSEVSLGLGFRVTLGFRVRLRVRVRT